jgi:hypothetical protein
MEDKIIVYQTFEDPIIANIILTRLQDAGFDCFLTGEHTAGLRPLFDSSISGIQLHVFEKDFEEITTFLKSTEEA